MRSTLRAICPECRKEALIEERLGPGSGTAMHCALCGFAYEQLAPKGTDRARLDDFLVTHLRPKTPMGLLVAFEVNRRLTKLPNLDSIQQIRDLAAKSGIDLPIPADNDRARNIAIGFTLFAMLSVLLYAFVASR